MNASEQVRLDSESWRGRYGGLQTEIYTKLPNEKESISISTNIMPTILPPGPLGSLIHGVTPIASDGGTERSSSDQVWSRPGARAWNTEVQQGKVLS